LPLTGAAGRSGGSELFIGLMSGTSIDAVDGVIARFSEDGHLEDTLADASVPIPPELRRQLSILQSPGPDELAAAALAGNSLADHYADCVALLLKQAKIDASDVAALGAHGQTVRHDPARGYTIQLLNGARLAERSCIDTVADLRSADVAAGGQGAPLVPAFHARVFGNASSCRAIVNIGGIANITVLGTAATAEQDSASPSGSRGPAGPSGSPGPTGPSATVIGYDTGPGNTLMDAWCEQHCGERFDQDGRWATTGQADHALLQRMLADPYFAAPPPKSTGRDLFNLAWLQRQLVAPLAPEDVQASLLELTVASIAEACRRHLVAEVFICGGGAANKQLIGRLKAALPDVPLQTTAALGLHPQAVEATAFAWLAHRRIRQLAGNLPLVTGASGPRVLGALYSSGSREG
jgi:anhydro-N-acetylmuramic acid kinase